ncbi:MAG: 2-oxo acid dehydrogenase subunit E2 [Deltaproteobacteria bacterium]|nr:2-oxo acid dehydrogenase subunit E2 [Deltaproteobacteria bacterium]
MVHRLAFAKGDIVPVGAVLIEIDDGAGAIESAPPPQAPATPRAPAAAKPAPPPPAPPAREASPPPAAAAPPRPRAVTTPSREPEPGAAHPPAMPPRPGLAHHRVAHAAGGDAVRAVPAVRELAKRLGVDLAHVAGSGPGGRVMRRDVELAASTPAPAPAPEQPASAGLASATVVKSEEPPQYGTAARAPDPPDWRRVPLRGLRRAISRHMREAKQHAAHFTYVEEIDLTALLEKSDALGGQKLSPLAFIARAVARGIPAHPSLNASLDEARDELVFKEKLHLGIAVAATDGLVVPVIRDAAALTTRDLALATDALARRAREGKLTPDELRGGTFTISSLGKLGGIVSTPIVNYPEVAILGVNAIRKLPRFVGDRVVARRLMNLSISVDHRVADGAHAAQFIADVKTILEAADFPDVFGPNKQGA